MMHPSKLVQNAAEEIIRLALLVLVPVEEVEAEVCAPMVAVRTDDRIDHSGSQHGFTTSRNTIEPQNRVPIVLP